MKSGEQQQSGGCVQVTANPLSYAEVVSPTQHGIKRTTSERDNLSPIGCCPKRTVVRCYPVETAVESTPLNCFADENNSPEEETPDYNTLCSKSNGAGVQRRLFASPKTGQQTTQPTEGNRYER